MSVSSSVKSTSQYPHVSSPELATYASHDDEPDAGAEGERDDTPEGEGDAGDDDCGGGDAGDDDCGEGDADT